MLSEETGSYLAYSHDGKHSGEPGEHVYQSNSRVARPESNLDQKGRAQIRKTERTKSWKGQTDLSGQAAIIHKGSWVQWCDQNICIPVPGLRAAFSVLLGVIWFLYTSGLQVLEMLIPDLLWYTAALQKVKRYHLHWAMVLRRNIKDENQEQNISAREEKDKIWRNTTEKMKHGV